MHNIELQPVHLSNTNDSPMGHALQSRAKEPIMVEVCLFWLRLSLPSYYQLVDLLIRKKSTHRNPKTCAQIEYTPEN